MTNLKISQGVYPDEYKLKKEFCWKVSFAKTYLKESNLNYVLHVSQSLKTIIFKTGVSGIHVFLTF